MHSIMSGRPKLYHDNFKVRIVILRISDLSNKESFRKYKDNEKIN